MQCVETALMLHPEISRNLALQSKSAATTIMAALLF